MEVKGAPLGNQRYYALEALPARVCRHQSQSSQFFQKAQLPATMAMRSQATEPPVPRDLRSRWKVPNGRAPGWGKMLASKPPSSDLPFATIPSSRDDAELEQCGALLNQSGENAPP